MASICSNRQMYNEPFTYLQCRRDVARFQSVVTADPFQRKRTISPLAHKTSVNINFHFILMRMISSVN